MRAAPFDESRSGHNRIRQRAADKVVFSRTLETVSTARTRIEATFDPEMIRQMKGSARSDLTFGGAESRHSRFGPS
jgi:hypothetical protein